MNPLLETPYLVACVVILVSIFLILIRAFRGPTVYDRILSVNAIGTKTVVFLLLLGGFAGRTGYMDIAILYALVNFVSTVAILKFVELNRLG